MKGSITFKFEGEPSDYRVHISREGKLDKGDLEVIATLLRDEMKLAKTTDPGTGSLHDHWVN